MSTSTAPPASASNLPSDSRSRPFRRLSQLRSYTQNHLSSSSSSSSANPNGQQRSSYRNSFSNRVPWRSSGSHQAAASSSAAAADSESATAHSTNASSCPEPERQSTLARYSSAFFSSYRGFETDLHSQGSSSSRSTPTDEPGASQTQTQTQAPGTMARLRGLTQTTDSRANNNKTTTTITVMPTMTPVPMPPASLGLVIRRRVPSSLLMRLKTLPPQRSQNRNRPCAFSLTKILSRVPDRHYISSPSLVPCLPIAV